MRKVSKIRNSREIDFEVQREDLRDRRWARHKSKVLTAATALSMILAADKAERILDWVSKI
jgi:hypothetical protein